MYKRNVSEIEYKKVEMEGAKDAEIKVLIDDKVGAPNFVMRVFRVKKDGCTPLHEHPWEHESFIMKGEGEIVSGDKTYPAKPGDFVFVPAGELHQFRNPYKEPLELICLIPLKKH